MINNIQYEISEFFRLLDIKLAEDEFIMLYGPADKFRDAIEQEFRNIENYEQKIEGLEEDLDDAEDKVEKLEEVEAEVEDAISDLESAISDPESIDIEMIKGVITDLKYAIK